MLCWYISLPVHDQEGESTPSSHCMGPLGRTSAGMVARNSPNLSFHLKHRDLYFWSHFKQKRKSGKDDWEIRFLGGYNEIGENVELLISFRQTPLLGLHHFGGKVSFDYHCKSMLWAGPGNYLHFTVRKCNSHRFHGLSEVTQVVRGPCSLTDLAREAMWLR